MIFRDEQPDGSPSPTAATTAAAAASIANTLHSSCNPAILQCTRAVHSISRSAFHRPTTTHLVIEDEIREDSRWYLSAHVLRGQNTSSNLSVKSKVDANLLTLVSVGSGNPQSEITLSLRRYSLFSRSRSFACLPESWKAKDDHMEYRY